MPESKAPLLAVITDYTFQPLDIERQILEPLGARVEARQCKTVAELIDLTADADAVITQFAPVNAEVIGKMRKARVIARYGIGVDNVDLDAARAKGIPVCNVPDYCIDEVADHAVGLMLATTRQLFPDWDKVRGGGWGAASAITSFRTLADMTVGVVGFGRIGRQVVARLKAFKCRVLVFDPGVAADQARAAGAEPVALDDIWANSDAITLHCPSTPQTRRIVNEQSLAKMKKGVILVNVGRGELVDPDALMVALTSGRVSGAGLDVWSPEPIQKDSPLLQMPNVILTPHVASASVKAVRALRESVAGSAARALRGEAPINVVNGVTTTPNVH